MPQDKHFNVRDPEIPAGLQDRKGTDMPAARTILLVILVTISAVVLFFSIRFVVKDAGMKDQVPASEQRSR